jgi:hypothetical protein
MRANSWLSRRIAQSLFLCLIVFIFLGAGDDKRFDKLGWMTSEEDVWMQSGPPRMQSRQVVAIRTA